MRLRSASPRWSAQRQLGARRGCRCSLECLSKPVLPEVEAEQGAAELKEREMDVGASVIAHPQATEAAQPSEVALHAPAVATEALLAFDAPPSNPRRNPAAPTRLPTVTGIIALVCMELVGPPAG